MFKLNFYKFRTNFNYISKINIINLFKRNLMEQVKSELKAKTAKVSLIN